MTPSELLAHWWQAVTRTQGLVAALRLFPRASLRFWRMRWPRWSAREAAILISILRSRNWGGFPCPNTHAARLEADFARLHGATHGVACSSGTAALQTVYRALQLRPGDEILVPATTFSSVAAAAMDLGITPVLVDVRPDTFCIDPAAAAELISPRTRAIVAVHLGAQMADLDALSDLSSARGIPLIEDCAHAHGAQWRGRGAGSHGVAGCFSFQSTKVMSAGEGGLIVTRDEAFAARCRSLVDCGRTATSLQAPQSVAGTNLRMTEFQAALLRCQLRRLPRQAGRRDETARLLDLRLGEHPAFETAPPAGAITRRPGYGYAFHYRLQGEKHLQTFLQDLFLRGIPASRFPYPPLYLCPEYGCGDPRVTRETGPPRRSRAAEAALDTVVWLPHMLLLCSKTEAERLARDIIACAGP